MLADLEEGVIGGTEGELVEELLRNRGVAFTDWHGWELLDAYEQELGTQWGELPSGGIRERVKVISRDAMTKISRGEKPGEDMIGEPGELGVPTAIERFEDYSGPK